MRRATDEGGVLMEDVGKGFGALRVLDGVSIRAAPGEVVAVVGPSGCGKTTLLELACGLQEPETGTVAAAPAVLMPQRDSLLPWAGALDNAALPLRLKGQDRATARAGAHETFARVRARRVRGRQAPRAVGRDAPARRVPAHAPGGQARPLPRRAVRLARRAHPPGAAGLARGGAAHGAAHGAARDARRRGGARARRPGLRPLAAPGDRPRDDRGRRSSARGSAPTPSWSRSASRRWRRSRHDRRAARPRVPRRLGALRPVGRRRRPHPPRPDADRGGDLGGPRAAVGQLPRDVLGGRGRPRSRRSSSAFGLAVALHFSRTARRAVYPLLVGVPGDPGGRHRAAAARVARLQPRAEGRDHRPRSASSRSS